MNTKNIIIASFTLLACFGGASLASATTTPTLYVSYIQNSNALQVTVTGDANAPVVLYSTSNQYNSYQYGANPLATLGYTNSGGYFSTTISNTAYNIPTNSLVYVMVDGISSSQVSWPSQNYNNYNNYNTYNTTYNNTVYFSQSSINLSVGQNTSVTIYGGYASGGYYMGNNSGLVATSISGNILTLYGNQSGSSTISVCSNSGASCGSLYVTVSGTYQYQYQQYPLSLSQTTIYLNAGQNQSVSIYGNGSYYVSNNSNSSIASAYVSENTLIVYGQTPGTSNITVCQNSGSCAVLYVSIASQYPVTTAQYYQPPQRRYPPYPRRRKTPPTIFYPLNTY